MEYVVILDVVLHGSSVGSTEDVIEAACADDAECIAINAWRQVRPECTFHALFIAEAHR